MAEHAGYDRQISTESGWDNPFRPDGDLSREADEIVSLIKGGKPITPTPPTAAPQLGGIEEKEHVINVVNASPRMEATSLVLQSTPKAINGKKNGVTAIGLGQVEVQRSQPQEPQQAEHVTIKKKPKCKCCVIQ